MKKILYIALSFIAVTISICSCNSDDDTWAEYQVWRTDNLNWYLAQKDSTVAGQKYYTELSPSWMQHSGVLIHYFNDRSLTAGNLVPMATSTVTVKYKGMLYNGVAFDSTTVATSDSVRTFALSGLITGWQVALQDMHVGDTCEVIIPYFMGYGANGNSGISPYSTLVFGMKLTDIAGYEIRK